MRLLANEESPTTSGARSSRERFAAKVLAAETAVLDAHRRGAFSATHVRYPLVYSPRAVVAFERWAVRRLLQGHRRLLVPDGGLSVYSRCAAKNAAHCIGLVVDSPDVAAGQVYQCADDRQFSVAEWLELIADALGVGDIEIVSAPLALARPVWPYLPTGPLGSRHTLVDTTKARRDLGYKDVVDPVAALRELVEYLAASPERTADPRDAPKDEAMVIGALDALTADLAAKLAWEAPEDYWPDWHTYDHPTEPGPECSSAEGG
ncbi:MAG TPA: NAD-dependent epimerase/dehydratase family protein [Acidimicrobiales bacterium]